MKKGVFFLFIFFYYVSYSQKQGNIWYFAGNNGIDFDSGNPVLLTNGQTPVNANIEGTATISDSLGNLLFYSTAANVWNKNHHLMQNQSGLLGGESSTQGSFIIPLPGSDSIFYLFSLAPMQTCFYTGLRYSIINMCYDNGLGGIDNSFKNILLLDTAGEKMAATFHSNGLDIWLVVHKYFSDAFYAYLIKSDGIVDTVISHVGSYHPADSTTTCNQAIGQMKISPNGSKISLVNANAIKSIAELFDFDNNSGYVSNLINLQPDTSLNHYGVSFSPDNLKLYLSKFTYPYQIVQFDLSSGVPSTITESRTIIYSSESSPITGLQLAPNGRIYVNRGTNFLDVISEPNNPGLTCGYIENGFELINPVSYSLPNFIDSYNYKNGIFDCDTCILSPIVKFNYNDTNLLVNFIDQSGGIAPNNWHWDFGDGASSNLQNPYHIYDTVGTYIITFTACNNTCCNTMMDTITVAGIIQPGFAEVSKYFHIYPNPAATTLTLQTTVTGNIAYSIYDLSSRLLQSSSFLKSKTIDVSGLAEGVYFIRVETEEGVLSRKFIKQ